MKEEKFYLTSTGREVTYGDTIKSVTKSDGIHCEIIITLTRETVPSLLKKGIIAKGSSREELDLNYVILELSSRLGWKPEKTSNILNLLSEMMPMAVVSVLAREIAVILDRKYSDHINEAEKIYVISTLDGRIHEVCKAHIKNFRNFAAFRTIDDAKLACSILREPLKEMFSDK